MDIIPTKVFCVLIRGSKAQVWITKNQKELLEQTLKEGKSKWIQLDGSTINVSDIQGIFSLMDMQQHQASGDWKCLGGFWHMRNEECKCDPLEVQLEKQEKQKLMREAIANCKRPGCKKGVIIVQEKKILKLYTGEEKTVVESKSVYCECIKDIVQQKVKVWQKYV